MSVHVGANLSCMDNDLIKRVMTDALVISVIITFCYGVHVASRAGRLISFGLYDHSSLISLEVPNVLVTVVKTGLYTLFTIVVVVSSLRAVGYFFRSRGALLAIILSFPVFLLMLLIYTLPIAVAFTSGLNGMWYGVSASTVYLFILVAASVYFTRHSYRVSRSKEPIKEAASSKLLSWFKDTKRMSETKILAYTMIAIFLLLLPIYGLMNGYTTPRSSSSYEVSYVDRKRYVIVDRTANSIVLAELEGDTVTRKYLFINAHERDRFATEVVRGSLSFSEVGPSLIFRNLSLR